MSGPDEGQDHVFTDCPPFADYELETHNPVFCPGSISETSCVHPYWGIPVAFL
jgi:hypothetical protein